MYDIIVAGGGPAGMTAALYGLRNGKKVLIIEKSAFGGQITFSPRVENIPGFISISGNDYADRFMEQLEALGAEFEFDEVTEVNDTGRLKEVRTAGGLSFTAPAIILAPGVKHRLPAIPNAESFIGNGISFCAVCDADFYRDKCVAVAGGGNSAFVEAALLSEKCSRVYMLQDLPYFTADKMLQDELLSKKNVESRFNVKLISVITENNEFCGIKIEDKLNNTTEDIRCDGLFAAIGLIPDNERFKALCDLTEDGYFIAGEDGITKTPGIFAAGDCRAKKVRQVTTAASDGAQAALSATAYLRSIGM